MTTERGEVTMERTKSMMMAGMTTERREVATENGIVTEMTTKIVVETTMESEMAADLMT